MWEVLLGGSPHPASFGPAVAGGGVVAALTKPYNVPGLIAIGRWKAAYVGAGWPLFVASMFALLLLPARTTLALAVPVPAPTAQPDYGLFGIGAIRSHPALALILGLPCVAAPGVVDAVVGRRVAWKRRGTGGNHQ